MGLAQLPWFLPFGFFRLRNQHKVTGDLNTQWGKKKERKERVREGKNLSFQKNDNKTNCTIT